MKIFRIHIQHLDISGEILYALPQGDSLKISPHPWLCVPIESEREERIFKLTADSREIDAISTGDILPIYSDRLLKILGIFKVKFEQIPVSCILPNGSQLNDCYIFHLLECKGYDLLYKVDDNGVKSRLPLKERWQGPMPPMFRNSDKRSEIFIREDLVVAIKAAGVKGLEFEEI